MDDRWVIRSYVCRHRQSWAVLMFGASIVVASIENINRTQILNVSKYLVILSFSSVLRFGPPRKRHMTRTHAPPFYWNLTTSHFRNVSILRRITTTFRFRFNQISKHDFAPKWVFFSLCCEKNSTTTHCMRKCLIESVVSLTFANWQMNSYMLFSLFTGSRRQRNDKIEFASLSLPIRRECNGQWIHGQAE